MHKSDSDLARYLHLCDPIEVHTLLGFLRSAFSTSSKQLADLYATPSSIPLAGSDARKQLAESVVGLLKWYGSDAIAYGTRWLIGREPSVGYHVIVRDVALVMNKNLKRKDRRQLPRVATVAEWEQIVVELLVGSAFTGKTLDEIVQMLREAGLDEDAARAAAKNFGPGLAGLGLPLLVKVLGKKTVVVILEKILVALVYRFIGKEAAQTLAKVFFKKLAQRVWARALWWIGWILVAIDVLLFAASPASRITVPTVAAISIFRIKAKFG